jgi:dsDNA-specific endonuclease/ATPase MutS2
MGSEPINNAVVAPSAQQVAPPDHSLSQLIGDSAGRRSQQPEVGDVQWVNPELNLIALAIEDLEGRLERANARLGAVKNAEPATELEIGRILVEAQRFSESALSHLEAKVHDVLVEAETKARQILVEATEEANQIRRQAQQARFASTHAARELQAAIAGFTAVNSELIEELAGLNDVLVSGTRSDATQGVKGAALSTPSPSLVRRS